MNRNLQPGMHPDAESLNAFAEQLLTAAEREQILLHIAGCSRCREVVFLAQRTAAEEQRATVPVSAAVAKKPHRSSFAGWRWSWVPVAALAGFVGFAVVQHYRHAAPQTQMAGNVAQTRAQLKSEAPPQTEAVQKPAETARPVQPLKERQTTERQARPRSKTEARDVANEKAAGKNFDELKQISRKDAGLGAIGTLASPPAAGGNAGGSIHGTMTARASGQSVGGPMAANQFQQQNANQYQQQNVARQNALQAAENAPRDYADRPVAKAAAPAAASETVTVRAEAKPAPAPPVPAQLSLSPVATQTVEVASDKVARAKKTKSVMLPSGLNALSSASVAKRTIAIDPSGALFLSLDNGGHWQAIPTQWTGRAVLVKVRDTSAASAVLAGAVQPRFELVTDKLQTWVSEDGKTWTAEAAGPK